MTERAAGNNNVPPAIVAPEGLEFQITDIKLNVPVNTPSTLKCWVPLSKGFKRSVYWNKYKDTDNKVVDITNANAEKHIRNLLDSSYQGVKRLFVLAYDNAASNNQVFVDFSKRCFLPRVKIENYNIELDRRN